MALDFKEISPANGSDGTQDTFENFARSFLAYQGYTIEVGPDRGPDGGRDLIVSKEITRKRGPRRIRFLVSCKHYAHSTKAVSEKEEVNIIERMHQHNCKGFIAFYSSSITSGLNERLLGLRPKFEIEIYNSGRIEDELLQDERGKDVARQYFKRSLLDYEMRDPFFIERATLSLRRKFEEIDPDYRITYTPFKKGVLIGLEPKRSEVPPPVVLELSLRFDNERDQDTIDAWHQLHAAGKPMIVRREHIIDHVFHAALTKAFPSLTELPEWIEFFPIGQPNVAQYDLVVESGDEEIARYGPITFDKNGGSTEFILSNAREGKPLQVDMAVSGQGGKSQCSLSIATDYRGNSVATALKAYRFASAFNRGTTIRLVHPDTTIGNISFPVPPALSITGVLDMLERLHAIQEHVGIPMQFPSRFLTEDERWDINVVYELLIAGKQRHVTGLSFEVGLSYPDIQDWLGSDQPTKPVVFTYLSSADGYDILGHEISIGPVFTLAMPILISAESLQTLREGVAMRAEQGTLVVEPLSEGAITTYRLETLAAEDLELLRSKLPNETFERMNAMRMAAISSGGKSE